MDVFVIVSFFATFFLALVDNYFDLKVGKLAVALVAAMLGSALMYSGSIPQAVAIAIASAFGSWTLLELISRRR